MIDQNTTLQPEDRVRLKAGRRIEGLPLLATGKVIRGFADLLAVAFDNDIDGMARIEICGEYVVNMVEKIGAESELDNTSLTESERVTALEKYAAQLERERDEMHQAITQIFLAVWNAWNHQISDKDGLEIALKTARGIQDRYPFDLGDDDSEPPQSKPGTGLGTHG